MIGESIKTSDVYGKELKEFKQRPELGGDQVPALFYILAGFFRVRPERFKNTVGVFRVTASDTKVKELETHMLLGNYAHLER